MCDKTTSVCKHLKLKTGHFVEVVSPVNISNVELNKFYIFCLITISILCVY